MPPTTGTPPLRRERWVLVISNKRDCRDPSRPTVIVALLSSQAAWQGRADELVRQGDGGTLTDSIVQTDLIFFYPKDDLRKGTLRGELMADSLNRVKARLRNTLAL
jgi:mRNA-degrading endonuclease toxin of MazEF toxin-antitoxin module